ncbi:MAG: hypothetical protein IKL14_00480 [Alphaproteobacteria bacterium]|nr:hypothetical protein [Alphaproteobacteria bacterium]
MSRLKKFWIVFLSFLPLTAAAWAPFVVAGIAGATAIVGFSVYRSNFPVSMTDAYQFFSSCWSCDMFASIMATMSDILPRIYSSLGKVIIPFAIILMAIWFAWTLIDNFLNNSSKFENPWSLASDFTNKLVKLAIVCIFLLAPLPRLITEIAIQPIFNVGMSLNRAVVHDDSFDSCVIATAIADPVSIDENAANRGAFSPKLRHNLTCELSGIHQMTGLGMAVGWTMINMAFDSDYMHKIMWNIPIFPNVVMFFAGLLVLVLFFMALVPIPIYFLEIFIKLSLDLVMLPLMLLAWLFKGWKISLAGAGKTISQIIDNAISGTLGLAATGVFVTFAIMFLQAVFGDWQGQSALITAITENDSKFLMDALMLNNDSLITIILMGIFITMFMTMIPALSKSLFNIEISQDFYNTAKNNTQIIWNSLKKWYESIKK